MGKRKYSETTYTLHATLTVDPGATHAVDVSASDTVSTIRDKVAGVLGVDGCDITLHHEGDELDDVGVTETTLVEGSVVVAAPSRRFTARSALTRMGMGWGEGKLIRLVKSGKGDEEKAGIAKLMLDAEEVEVSYALCFAIVEGLLETVRVLVPKGVGGNKFAPSPLLQAVHFNRVEIAKCLISHGANISQLSKTYGETLLHHAAGASSLAMVSLLVAHGADIEATDCQGRAPLHVAAEAGRIDVVQYLVSHNADMKRADKQGLTPFHVAKRREVIKYLAPSLSS